MTTMEMTAIIVGTSLLTTIMQLAIVIVVGWRLKLFK